MSWSPFLGVLALVLGCMGLSSPSPAKPDGWVRLGATTLSFNTVVSPASEDRSSHHPGGSLASALPDVFRLLRAPAPPVTGDDYPSRPAKTGRGSALEMLLVPVI
ncbi:hypothetical protein BP5796_01037 [Coleophoma crateriformis]|uniref:Secreted protein n=1 Tax=Coleophoma crateriformis TaxID=565419 RepID=A0A3D8T9S6_9HELO|nr:hypothetical protein BP5796_01037 [Coleophoma crateriformis]